jgi:peptidoglycan hydrolase-like protein with peptidoglycan-binding domain
MTKCVLTNLRLLLAVALVVSVTPTIADAKKQRALRQKEILEAEERLSSLGYWTGPVDGKFDRASRQALVAFQKIGGRKRTGRLTPEELAAVLQARPHHPKETGYFHVEVDLYRQVLFVVDDDGRVSKILPISSGNDEWFTSEGWTRKAFTPRGRFTVIRKIEGWRKSPLGLLYYPCYITEYGIAIHGNPDVPTRPASHGCIRIPMFAARDFSRILALGTVVLVYDDYMQDQLPVPQE